MIQILNFRTHFEYYSDVYATPNISFGNPTLKFYRLLSIFCMSLMVVEMVIKIIMKAANLMCRIIHESLTVFETRTPSGRKPDV